MPIRFDYGRGALSIACRRFRFAPAYGRSVQLGVDSVGAACRNRREKSSNKFPLLRDGHVVLAGAARILSNTTVIPVLESGAYLGFGFREPLAGLGRRPNSRFGTFQRLIPKMRKSCGGAFG
jgi:hypothetical protein